MPPNTRPTTASQGLKLSLDNTASIHNDKNYDWFIEAVRRIEAMPRKMTKKQACEEMNITLPTFEKYYTIHKIERIQHRNPKREEVNQ